MLLDGRAATFACAVSDDAGLLLKSDPLEWIWSSHVRHVVSIHPPTRALLIRRWDDPTNSRRFNLPSTREEATKILQVVESARPVRAQDAIDYVLAAFRSTREILPDDALGAVQVFNLMLFATAKAKIGEIDVQELKTANVVADVLRIVRRNHEVEANFVVDREPSSDVVNRPLFAAMHRFLTPEPRFNYSLDPLLLLRHASGDLYQEAHLEIEETSQLRLAGFDPQRPKGAPRLGIRFTPPTFARSLSERAIAAADLSAQSLVILDPACGSGVFLIEALRELQRREYRGRIFLRGIDRSDISAAMAQFCLRFAVDEARVAGFKVDFEVVLANSLTCDWSSADVILMNPPFVPWAQIDDQTRELVRSELLDSQKGRTDLAMAFILRAAKALRPGGAFSAILPSPLLESTHGVAWRQELARLVSIELIGKFEGYAYFTSSMVEPAFIVARKGHPAEVDRSGLELLIAKSGAEEKSLRALRSPDIAPSEPETWSFYPAPKGFLDGNKWMPRWPQTARLERKLFELATPRVGHIFDVRQGALTGLNEAFLLTAKAINRIEPAELRYFQPAAGTKNISAGRVERGFWVFYPYEDGRLLIETEDQLHELVPTYYKNFLLPHKAVLQAREGMPHPERWWSLTRAREWQRLGIPKLMSSYFGKQGGFAYDQNGEFAVVHGYAWLWKVKTATDSFDDEDPVSVDVPLNDTLALAYLAILNSSVFEQLLAFSCPRVAGSQFNLSKRFVSDVFLPDLTAESTPEHVLRALATFGREIHGGVAMSGDLEEAVAFAYGIDISLLEPLLLS